MLLIHEDREHETGLLVVVHAIEKADCFEQWRGFELTEAGLEHLDSCGFVVPVCSGQSLNPAFERYLPGLICVSAFLIQGVQVFADKKN